nr:MAG TPA: hypothetical protein [Caudoviricetes sp.]
MVSPESETRRVSPMPSSKSAPIAAALLTIPPNLRPASVTPR